MTVGTSTAPILPTLPMLTRSEPREPLAEPRLGGVVDCKFCMIQGAIIRPSWLSALLFEPIQYLLKVPCLHPTVYCYKQQAGPFACVSKIIQLLYVPATRTILAHLIPLCIPAVKNNFVSSRRSGVSVRYACSRCGRDCSTESYTIRDRQHETGTVCVA